MSIKIDLHEKHPFYLRYLVSVETKDMVFKSQSALLSNEQLVKDAESIVDLAHPTSKLMYKELRKSRKKADSFLRNFSASLSPLEFSPFYRDWMKNWMLDFKLNNDSRIELPIIAGNELGKVIVSLRLKHLYV